MQVMEAELTPLQRLIFAYAPAKSRAAYDAIFALDNRCGAILRGTSEVMLGQMRLAWWRDMLAKPAAERPQGDPVVHALGEIENDGLNLKTLLPIVDAWELLLVSEELTHEQIEDYADQRGVTIFNSIAVRSGLENSMVATAKAGHLWAIWDLARHSADDNLREALLQKLQEEQRFLKKFSPPRSMRPLSIMLRLAHKDAAGGSLEAPIMRPATAAQIIWHGLTGL